MTDEPADGRAGIDAALVRRLVAAQFPQWADLAVAPVAVDGWDNRTYRLGEQLTARLPTNESYVPAVAKEYRWLPRLAPSLPVPIPTPVALGAPGEGYPYPWSIRGWLSGTPASPGMKVDPVGLARDVAEFVVALRGVDPRGGPAAGVHSFHRGAPLMHYDDEARRSLTAVRERVDARGAVAAWEAALDASWSGAPSWFHGDLAAGNLLTHAGRLAAVIDFGTCGVGDPSCDQVIAWTLFAGASRAAFRDAVAADDASWARARGWALWKSLLTLAGPDRTADDANLRIVADVIAEHRRVG